MYPTLADLFGGFVIPSRFSAASQLKVPMSPAIGTRKIHCEHKAIGHGHVFFNPESTHSSIRLRLFTNGM